MDFSMVVRIVPVVKGFVGEADERLDSAFVPDSFGEEIPLDKAIRFLAEFVDGTDTPGVEFQVF